MRRLICTALAVAILPACAARHSTSPAAAAPPAAESNPEMTDLLAAWRQMQIDAAFQQSAGDAWRQHTSTIIPPLTVDRGYDIHAEGWPEEFNQQIKRLLEKSTQPPEPDPDHSP